MSRLRRASMPCARPVRRHFGQSTTEFAVLALALVPLFIIIPLLGTYLDMAQTTEVAARYVAFEGTVRNSASTWKTDAELADEVRRRFFSNSDAPIKTNDIAGNFAANRNPLYSDYTGKPLLANFATDVGVSTLVESKAALAAAAYSGQNGFKLGKDNLYTGTVTVKPRNVAALAVFDSIDLTMSRSTTVLVDSWEAASPQVVKNKIESDGRSLAYLIGGGLADPVNPGLKGIGQTFAPFLKGVLEPPIDVGNVNPEVVPCDRLSSGCP
jgi:hypothetical protein